MDSWRSVLANIRPRAFRIDLEDVRISASDNHGYVTCVEVINADDSKGRWGAGQGAWGGARQGWQRAGGTGGRHAGALGLHGAAAALCSTVCWFVHVASRVRSCARGGCEPRPGLT